jgi:hypothetical protein
MTREQRKATFVINTFPGCARDGGLMERIQTRAKVLYISEFKLQNEILNTCNGFYQKKKKKKKFKGTLC